jgi:hypothetical protein
MDKHTIAEVLASLTVAEFRQFKRALAILHRSHVSTADAIDILVSAHVSRTRYRAA